jgi:hypothetical protein
MLRMSLRAHSKAGTASQVWPSSAERLPHLRHIIEV